MISQKQKEKACMFSDMHKKNKLFVLPNAWSAGSAYVFEKQGFKAVATSSERQPLAMIFRVMFCSAKLSDVTLVSVLHP
jgi:2-methylisocitrate lyase-like PEP mutase family enzyme